MLTSEIEMRIKARMWANLIKIPDLAAFAEKYFFKAIARDNLWDATGGYTNLLLSVYAMAADNQPIGDICNRFNQYDQNVFHRTGGHAIKEITNYDQTIAMLSEALSFAIQRNKNNDRLGKTFEQLLSDEDRAIRSEIFKQKQLLTKIQEKANDLSRMLDSMLLSEDCTKCIHNGKCDTQKSFLLDYIRQGDRDFLARIDEDGRKLMELCEKYLTNAKEGVLIRFTVSLADGNTGIQFPVIYGYYKVMLATNEFTPEDIKLGDSLVSPERIHQHRTETMMAIADRMVADGHSREEIEREINKILVDHADRSGQNTMRGWMGGFAEPKEEKETPKVRQPGVIKFGNN